eukprot:g13995.t1
MEPAPSKAPGDSFPGLAAPACPKVTLVSLESHKQGLKLQLGQQQHQAPGRGGGTVPGVTLTVRPGPGGQGAKARGAGPTPAAAQAEGHDGKTKTVILTSPYIKWFRSNQSYKVINLPLGVVPAFNVSRLHQAKNILISRPGGSGGLNQIIIHKEALPPAQ